MLAALRRPYLGLTNDYEMPQRGLSEVFDIIDAKFTDLRKIQPPAVSGFWSGATAKARAMKALTAADVVRNCLFVVRVLHR